MTFSPQSLSDQLAGFLSGNLAGRTLIVALSGGLDSTVLLHAIWQLQRTTQLATSQTSGSFFLKAIHVNHGLSPYALEWEASCQHVCDDLQIPLYIERISIDLSAGASLENLARQKRYGVFERQLGTNDCLLMAHHLDDQAETFLMRTLRGAGPRGLAAIPAQRALGNGILLRPLLEFSRAELAAYAHAERLQWIEDESNDSIAFDRNYCRLSVLPLIEQRWPNYRANWHRSAALSAESEELLNDLAALDYLAAQTTTGTSLQQSKLIKLSKPRQRNLLRHWFALIGLTGPGWNVVNQIVKELIPAPETARPEVRWQDRDTRVCVRRHNAEISIHIESGLTSAHANENYEWNISQPLSLPENGVLLAVKRLGQGLNVPANTSLVVRYRHGGEQCCLAGRKTRPLKKILQEANLAPWVRSRLPLLYLNDVLVCIPGVGVCEGWAVADDEEGWSISWDPSA